MQRAEAAQRLAARLVSEVIPKLMGIKLAKERRTIVVYGAGQNKRELHLRLGRSKGRLDLHNVKIVCALTHPVFTAELKNELIRLLEANDNIGTITVTAGTIAKADRDLVLNLHDV